MKLILSILLLLNSTAQAEPFYSFDSAAQVFQEYQAQVQSIPTDDKGTKATYIDIVSQYFLALSPSDYNQLLTYILNFYLENPEERDWIFEVLMALDHHAQAMDESNKSDNLVWSAADGAITGAFVLTLVYMGVSLSRTGVFKVATEKVLNRFFGKAKIEDILSASARRLPGPTTSFRTRFFSKGQAWVGQSLGTSWGAYSASAIAGAGVGSTLYFLRTLQEKRYSITKLLLSIHTMLLAEAAVAACEFENKAAVFDLSEEESLELLKTYKDQLIEIQKKSPELQHILSGTNFIDADKFLSQKIGSSQVLEVQGSCELTKEDSLLLDVIVYKIDRFLE